MYAARWKETSLSFMQPEDRELAALWSMHRFAVAAIREASRYSLSDLLSDPELAAGLKYNIMAIGEAARRVSQLRQLANPDINWQSIIGMRHILAHDYEYVDVEILWSTATVDAPQLVALLESLLRPNDEVEG
jgi:uncharacterized protein with HEPN domain